jgi:hypothetical protein
MSHDIFSKVQVIETEMRRSKPGYFHQLQMEQLSSTSILFSNNLAAA